MNLQSVQIFNESTKYRSKQNTVKGDIAFGKIAEEASINSADSFKMSNQNDYEAIRNNPNWVVDTRESRSYQGRKYKTLAVKIKSSKSGELVYDHYSDIPVKSFDKVRTEVFSGVSELLSRFDINAPIIDKLNEKNVEHGKLANEKQVEITDALNSNKYNKKAQKKLNKSLDKIALENEEYVYVRRLMRSSTEFLNSELDNLNKKIVQLKGLSVDGILSSKPKPKKFVWVDKMFYKIAGFLRPVS